jgi:hypothetical protein
MWTGTCPTVPRFFAQLPSLFGYFPQKADRLPNGQRQAEAEQRNEDHYIRERHVATGSGRAQRRHTRWSAAGSFSVTYSGRTWLSHWVAH